MKTKRSLSLSKLIISTFIVGIVALSFNKVNAQADFLISKVVPAARGSVKVNKDKYNNYIIDIQVINLAEASRLTPPKNTYVVWMVTGDSLIKNIGQVRTVTSLLFKKLKASFETKSSFKPVKIYITAEYDPNLQSTNSEVILTTDYFNLPKP
jgi:hypothetical protein